MFRLRTATTNHADLLGELEARSARFAYQDIGSSEYLASLQPDSQAIEFDRRLKSPPTNNFRIFIAEEDETAHGFAEIEQGDDDCGLLHKMYFVPEALGRGLGPVLHEAVIQQFKAWGCTDARLTFVQGNIRAEAFYLRNGWAPSGELIPFDDHGRTLVDVVLRSVIDANPLTMKR
jgi:GNAT superfamily N-acetyltransferase